MTRVLVVDDNPQDRLLVRRALLAEFEDAEVLEAPDQATLDTLLASHQFDAVVTDFRLRWSDGLKVLDAIHASHPYTPVVMFTNTGSEEIAASGLRHGLVDYIIKAPGRYARVAHAVRHGVRREEVRQLEADLLAREQAARRAAEDANRIKDEFLATVSHELRTPLHAITGWFHVMKNQIQEPSPTLVRDCDAIERNTALLARVVEDLMDNARILSGKLTLAPQPTAVEDAVRGAIPGGFEHHARVHGSRPGTRPGAPARRGPWRASHRVQPRYQPRCRLHRKAPGRPTSTADSLRNARGCDFASFSVGGRSWKLCATLWVTF